MTMLFQDLLRRLVHQGSLRLIAANGRLTDYGDDMPPACTIKLHRKSLEWTLPLNLGLRVPEAYMNGTLTIESGDLRDFLAIALSNLHWIEADPFVRGMTRLRWALGRTKQFNPLARARRNVAKHYDLSPELYDLFLDADRHYSCAYFREPGESLEKAQQNKLRHLLSKLYVTQQGLSVLDIGSGWGGLGLYLAREAGCKVTGVTLSTEQYRLSKKRAEAAGLAKACDFKLSDYRLEKGPYDRIVSVGMFEHVGKKNYNEFFAKIRDLLSDDGVCVLHSIGRFDKAAPINPFIAKYIFPGADLPSLSEVFEAVEQVGLFATDVEILRLHYAETLRRWYDRFQAHRAEAAKIYDEEFCRKWSFYLASCEMGFRYGGLMVFQIQLTKKLETLPLTRDYMADAEAETALSALAADVRERMAKEKNSQ